MSSYSGGEEDLVDVEKRKRQAEYTLGDPLLFPLEFINWLKRYIEQSGIQLPASQIFGLPSGGGAGSLTNYPPGLIFPFAGPVVPEGAHAADGSLLNKADYPVLWAQLGDTWGVSTADQFYLPDLRDRALYGAGPQMPVGMTDLRPVNSRGPWHHHTINIASAAGGGHTHNISITTDNKGAHSHGGGVGGGGGHSHGGSADNGGDHQHGPANGPAFASTSGGTFTHGTGSQSRFLITDFGPTAWSGPHSHTLSIDGVADHGHSISSDGGHTHAASGTADAAAAHTHQVVGDTSGVGQLDVGGFASVLYVITTG